MKSKIKILVVAAALFPSMVSAQQLITMSNKCYKQVQAAKQQNDKGLYKEAFAGFDKVLKDCSAKDAKEEANLGKAIAANGLEKYNDALGFANNAIKVSKNGNVMAYYARSYAYRSLGKVEEARADLEKITELTKKNRDIKARAQMFAQLAHLDFQLNMLAQADTNLKKAVELDPANPAFFVQKGDMMVKINDYDDAFLAYDQAIDLGKNDLEIYQIRTEARLKQLQQKYVTTDVKELSARLNKSEKVLLCGDMKKAIELGLRNLQIELLATSICE